MIKKDNLTEKVKRTDFEIKYAQAGDIPALSEADKNCFPASPWGEEAFFNNIKNPFDHCLACKNPQGVLMGYAILRILDGAELLLIGTESKFRRKGVADSLLEKMTEIAERENASEIFLEVREGNDAARSLYKKHGFSEVGRRKRYYHDPSEDAVLMKKTIAEIMDIDLGGNPL